MSASFNKVILLGNLTRDPQVRYTASGTAVTDLGLAVNRTWYDKQTNQRHEEATFVDVTLWGRQAEVAGEYLSKGRSVLIEGYLQLDQWDDRETGQKRSKLKVVCENMKMVGGRADGGGGGSPGGPRQQRPASAPAGGPSDRGSDRGGSDREPHRDEPQRDDPVADFYDTPSGQDVPEDEVPF